MPDMTLSNVYGCFVYKRRFFVDKSSLNDVTELYISGVQNTVSAWINGVYLGRHEGFSSDFTFSLANDSLVEGENEIVLVVSNILNKGYKDRPVSGCINRAANGSTGGVYGDVELRSYVDGLKDVFVHTAKDLSSFTVYTEGGTSLDREVLIKDKGKIIRQAIIKKGETKVTLSTEGFALWDVDNPKRYEVIVNAGGACVSRLVGLRRLTVADDGIHLRLNKKPYFFRAICEHGYYPLTVHPPRDKKYFRRVITKLKGLGFNGIRFHTWVPIKEYLQAADELGMLIEVETPNNTPYEEWREIIEYTKKYTSIVMYSSGNEMIIDEEYIEHLRKCAALVHEKTDSLFSPMSAMRGIEYFTYGDNKVDEPFPHNPVRLEKLGAFCDVYNSYSLGRVSYWSEQGDAAMLDERSSIYKKPLLTHEICIQGTYQDLTLKDRYKGTRIGDTELFTSVEKHLEAKGLIDRAPVYYRNSVEWQRLLRKHCFETVRRSKTFAGYDYLGDIDHHWHTFGYCVGMMNEFYELKAGETQENVLRYNNDVVLLLDLPHCVNFYGGEKMTLPIHVSNYANNIKEATLSVKVCGKNKVYFSNEIQIKEIKAGAITPLAELAFTTPKVQKPENLKIVVELFGVNVKTNNVWDIYVFPKVRLPQTPRGVTVVSDIDQKGLERLIKAGKKIAVFGVGPLQRIRTSFQISCAGRTEGHLATVINDHLIMKDFSHEGFCGWQFRDMLNGGCSAVLDVHDLPFAPIIEIASSYKYARKEALMFEYSIGKAKLFVCTLNLPENDPAARYLKYSIYKYLSSEFNPEQEITYLQLDSLCHTEPVCVIENTNEANNANDITM